MRLYNSIEQVYQWAMSIYPNWFDTGQKKLCPELERTLCILNDWPMERSRRHSYQIQAAQDVRNLYQHQIMCSHPEFPWYGPEGFHKDYKTFLKRQMKAMRQEIGMLEIDIQHAKKGIQIYAIADPRFRTCKRIMEQASIRLAMAKSDLTQLEEAMEDAEIAEAA